MESKISRRSVISNGCARPGARRFALFLGLALFAGHANAFSLMGPFTSWMDVEKSYRLPGDIGGPMNIGEGYRWNVPVITYGFDHSFTSYFGSNGVAAVSPTSASSSGPATPRRTWPAGCG